jgi:Beta-galactosidase
MCQNSQVPPRILSMLLALAGFCCLATHAMGEGAKPVTRAAIRGDGTLLVDGKPVFPVGVRSEKLHEIDPIAKCGFNLILGSGEWTPAHYAAARKRNLLIMGGHHVWATFRGAKKGIDLTALEEEGGVEALMKKARDQSNRTIPEVLKTFDHLPGVIGWKIADEPRGSLSQIVGHGYEIIKSHSPNHLVAVMTDKQDWAASFRHSSDLLLLDLFAIRGKDYPHKQAASISDIITRMKTCAKAMEEKTFWYMPQLYPPSAWRPFNTSEELSLGDMRLQVYAGLIAGAKGIVFYHWGVMDKAKKRENGNTSWIKVSDAILERRTTIVKSAVAELHKLGPILCNGRPNTDPYVRWFAPGKNGPGPQYIRAIEYEGQQYLFVMNLLDQPISAKVYGRNFDSNAYAYDAAVFAGKGNLSTTLEKSRPRGKKGAPILTVGPRGAGVFVLTRRSLIK